MMIKSYQVMTMAMLWVRKVLERYPEVGLTTTLSSLQILMLVLGSTKKKVFSDILQVCIMREIKLLRLLRRPDIVEIKHILLPPSRSEFKDIYVVFELMGSGLHQLHLEPASSNSLPGNGNGSITQKLRVTNTQHGKKAIIMHIRISTS
ncbi:unnamed protein product [Lactuca virosa]|uniref:Clathrin adaptor alpha/beta/gamma-adaptin appendage Ig-like subdomain domain-containing protein n=1 Tax=Lactuca virosa TaxID=75947 RepID=A0AAU9NLG4_9ASTR|nr:unnamed protein product [Lactuca virosa]